VAVVLDSAAIVAFLDGDDALHVAAETAIRELMPRHQLYASAVTFSEVLTGAFRSNHDEEVVRGFFAELIGEILPVGEATAERAARLRADRKSLRMPDALIIATADAHPEVDAILTGDAQFKSVRGLGCRIKLLR
jgi:predicted nucleic acid-binding protein